LKKKAKQEVKDVEPKYAAGKAKIYMKDKWGWKDAPSIPNRPSKGGFIYKQLFEELSQFVKENEPVDEVFTKADYEKAKVILSKLKDTNSKLYNAIIAFASDVYPHDLDQELGADIQAAIAQAASEVPITQAKTLIAVAGTATTVAAAALDLPQYDRYAIHLARISAAQVHATSSMFLTKNREERLALGYMHPGRVDVIPAGALVLSEIVKATGATGFVASESDILDGMARSLVNG